MSGAPPAVTLKSQAWPALKKKGGHRGQPVAAKREDVPMVRGFYSTEEVFRGGLRAALNGGWGVAEICFIFHIY